MSSEDLLSPALLFAESPHLGVIYDLANKLSDRLQILDFGPVGSRAVLLIQGPSQEIHLLLESQAKVKSALEITVVLRHVDIITQTYLSMMEAPLQSVLMVAESNSLAEILKLAEILVEKGLGLIELRKIRGHEGKAYLLATGPSAIDAPSSFPGQLQVIEPVTPSVRHLFTPS